MLRPFAILLCIKFKAGALVAIRQPLTTSNLFYT